MLGKIVNIVFSGNSVTSASRGNIGTVPNEMKPSKDVWMAVNSGRNVGIALDGTMSLYSSDLSQFASGSIISSVIYVI